MLLKLVLLILCSLVTVHSHQHGYRNSHWDKEDPRWDTKIPNWWDGDDFVPPRGPAEEGSRDFWVKQGQKLLDQKVKQKVNFNRAKNLVIFIGDGMGLSTQMAARSYIGDVKSELSFEKFPFSGLSKTYCVNYQVPDSACTATAILSGIKNNLFVLSLTSDVVMNNCTASRDNSTHFDSIFKYAQDAGKATGFVTTTRVTHATPAATYAHAAMREWESNDGVPEGCDDIAHQLVHGEVGSKLDVMMGGGMRSFLPNTHVNERLERGHRTDNRNLINEFKETQRLKNKRFGIIENRKQLENINVADYDKFLGIFAHSHMEYKLLSEGKDQPTLLEMTVKSLELLKKNKEGFVLLVEGGRIDHGHHETRARLALHETAEFEKAVEYVKNNTDEDDTLIVVTADHSHVFTVGGYTPRDRNILGVGDFSPLDQKWFFALNYANGPGYADHITETGGRRNPRGMNYMDPQFRQPANVPNPEETHSGEDVGVYASGPFAHLFSGVYEQNYIAHAMAYAACIGPDDFKKNPECSPEDASTDVGSIKVASSILLTLALIIQMF